jgi:hypothetical protein
VLSNPLTATIGPDLRLVGTSCATNYAISAGTTEDFGLPEQVDQIINVVHVASLMLSETISTDGLPNLTLIYPLPAIVGRQDLAKPCPHSVNRDRKLHSTRLGGIGILTKSGVSPQGFYGIRPRAGRGVGTTAARGLNEGVASIG